MKADSPVSQLVKELMAHPNPADCRKEMSHQQVFARIHRAIADEYESAWREERPYDAVSDLRTKWLIEWAEVLEGLRRRITPGLVEGMQFLFMDRDLLLSGRDLAAGERREPLTLVQG